jgi:hypothetical protein
LKGGPAVFTEETNIRDLSECTPVVVDDSEADINIVVAILGDDDEVAVATDGQRAIHGSGWHKFIFSQKMKVEI